MNRFLRCSGDQNFRLLNFITFQIVGKEGGRPGLVVMGGGPCSKGHGFESWQHKLDRHFFT